jgi:hypothetical protein
MQKVGSSLMFILVDAYGAAGSFVFGTCCVDTGCADHSLFPMFRQRQKEAEERLLQITIIVLLVLK